MTAPENSHAMDVAFHVPFVHRLRFTDDLWGRDIGVLIELLQNSGDQPARVQFWLDENVESAWPTLQSRIETSCRQAGPNVNLVLPIQRVPGGEAIKNDIHILERMLKVIHAADLDRRSYVVVIGGGAVLDAVGFAAAISHRGIRLIRIPTTTLAQADSGIGVKNSVNLFQQKNWVGTFAVPWAVINDASSLKTLSDRDFLSGFSEAVKVAALKDKNFFHQLERSAAAICRREPTATTAAIRASAQHHLDHITRGGDPFEMNEARPLDFGHWSAHRLEVLSDFRLRHGEAVGIGVAIDTVYSSRVHGLAEQEMQRVLSCLERLGLRLEDPVLENREAMLEGLEEFRQHLGGRLTVTMLQGIGQSFEVHEIDQLQMCQSIQVVADRAWSPDYRTKAGPARPISQES